MRASGIYLEPVGSDADNPFDAPAREADMAAWKMQTKNRSTGDIVTAAIWNDAYCDSDSAARQQADALLERYREPTTVGGSGPELVTPIVQAASELFVECERCAQVNLLEPKQAYKGCGACGAPFSLEAVKEAAGVEPVRVTGREMQVAINATNKMGEAMNNLACATKVAAKAAEKLGSVNYWVFGAPDTILGENTILGF